MFQLAEAATGVDALAGSIFWGTVWSMGCFLAGYLMCLFGNAFVEKKLKVDLNKDGKVG